MKKLAIIGCGDLGKQVAHYARQTGKYEVVGWLDDTVELGKHIDGVTVLGGTKDAQWQYDEGIIETLFVAVGYAHMDFRKSIYENYADKIPFANIIHSSAYIDPSVTLGRGVIIMPRAILEMGVQIGDNALIYSGCTIAHETQIGRHSFLSPGVSIAGYVEVGESCNLGIGTVVVDKIKIADGVQTGAGTVVISDITEPGTYVGAPHRSIGD